MLKIKSEDGKVLDIDRSKFKEVADIIDHSNKIFQPTDEQCLVSEPIHGTCGVIVTNYKTIGNLKSFIFRYPPKNYLSIHKGYCLC